MYVCTYDEEFAKAPTALSSPRFPHLAKCALRLALELPAATPHNALRMLEKPNNTTLGVFGKAGDRQSSTIALSLNISAASLYILHSGSSEVPSLCANRIVATLPILSCNTESKIAAVGDAEASPTPTPGRKIMFEPLMYHSSTVCSTNLLTQLLMTRALQ